MLFMNILSYFLVVWWRCVKPGEALLAVYVHSLINNLALFMNCLPRILVVRWRFVKPGEALLAVYAHSLINNLSLFMNSLPRILVVRWRRVKPGEGQDQGGQRGSAAEDCPQRGKFHSVTVKLCWRRRIRIFIFTWSHPNK